LLRIVRITQEKAAVEFVDSSGRVIATGVVVESSLGARLGGVVTPVTISSLGQSTMKPSISAFLT
jgi:hypothetical protein